jgi:putative DNA primase/helicase
MHASRQAKANGGTEPLDRPPALSDEALALAFAARHASDLRYVAAWGRWYRYDGTRWQPDDTLAAFDLARHICREAAAECAKPKLASAVASAKTVAAVERLAKADRRIAATIAEWDADPWLLNTPGGVLDLRTGRHRPHCPTDYMTKLTAVAPSDGCPAWKGALAPHHGWRRQARLVPATSLRLRADG